MSINFNDIIIKNKIGTGMYGTVFLIKHNNNKYALKIQKVLKKDIKKDYLFFFHFQTFIIIYN